MEVILREDIENLGERGNVVTVRPGYARNFLLPKKLAVPATEANKKIVAQERDAHLRREAKVQSEAEGLAALLKGVEISIIQKAGENDQLFGSVTAQDLAVALEKQNFTIDRRKIQLDEPIKMLGEFEVPVKLHRNVTVGIKVRVVKEETAEAGATPAEA